MCACTILVLMMLKNMIRNRRLLERRSLNNRLFVRHENRLHYLNSILGNDRECVSELIMDLKTFGLLCDLLRANGRLKNDGLVTVEEQVFMFLHVLTHHVKNRTVRNRFVQSGDTISRYFNSVLQGILRLQGSLLRVPEPVVDVTKKPRYQTRRGEIATNVLAVCSHDMQFIFVLSSWEGSASDSRILLDAITTPNGLRTNGEGFLAPCRGIRYHLSEWREGNALVNHQEYFNMKHAKARNVIERVHLFYPIKTQCRIITACCLLHNLIRKEMSRDPLEHEINEIEEMENVIEGDMVGTVGASDEGTTWRNDLALQMHNEWQGNANN
ncbi:hypothetical protein ACE6H2_026323 [Prunus campanulata]